MDRQAFKQRMQNLKSYRENNPGKGYWDWKVEAFQGGGEIGNEERQYLHSWYTNRREYAKRHMPAMLKQLDDADIYINPNSRIRNIYSMPITISNDKIKQASKDSGIGEYGGYYHPNEGVVLPSDYKQWKDREPLLHELNHVVNTFNSSIFDQVNKVLEGKQIIDRGQEVNNYLTTPSEVQSRLIEFRKLNNLDPTKVYGIPDVREWRRTGKDADLLNTFDDDTVLELINTVAHTPNKKVQRAAEGGQTGDPEKERFYQATGRSSSGRPLEEGLKPVFSLEDAANMTPIGDAISAKDAYDAVKNRDWLGAGLAAVTMIPFVPTTVRNFRKKYKGVTPKREIPTVNKKAIDNAIDEAKNYRDGRIKLYQQAIEDRNASYERLIENEDALRRAVNFDKKYGTNYVKTYTKQLQNYAKSKNSPDLMQIGIKPMSANGSFDPNIPDYVFINSDYVKNGKLQPGLISHEKSHYDNQKAGALSLPIFDNRFVDTKKTKTMYPKTYDWIQRYLHNFEETKSHMNEFRTNMINKSLLKPDSKVGLKQIKDLIFNSDNDNMKKLFNTYKSKRQFVKDFNSVPITSIGDNKTLV